MNSIRLQLAISEATIVLSWIAAQSDTEPRTESFPTTHERDGNKITVMRTPDGRFGVGKKIQDGVKAIGSTINELGNKILETEGERALKNLERTRLSELLYAQDAMAKRNVLFNEVYPDSLMGFAQGLSKAAQENKEIIEKRVRRDPGLQKKMQSIDRETFNRLRFANINLSGFSLNTGSFGDLLKGDLSGKTLTTLLQDPDNLIPEIINDSFEKAAVAIAESYKDNPPIVDQLKMAIRSIPKAIEKAIKESLGKIEKDPDGAAIDAQRDYDAADESTKKLIEDFGRSNFDAVDRYREELIGKTSPEASNAFSDVLNAAKSEEGVIGKISAAVEKGKEILSKSDAIEIREAVAKGVGYAKVVGTFSGDMFNANVLKWVVSTGAAALGLEFSLAAIPTTLIAGAMYFVGIPNMIKSVNSLYQNSKIVFDAAFLYKKSIDVARDLSEGDAMKAIKDGLEIQRYMKNLEKEKEQPVKKLIDFSSKNTA